MLGDKTLTILQPNQSRGMSEKIKEEKEMINHQRQSVHANIEWESAEAKGSKETAAKGKKKFLFRYALFLFS